MKKGLTNINGGLTFLLIIYTIFINKFIYLAPNLSVSISLIIYSITFLLPVLIFDKYSAKDAKNTLIISTLFVIGFYTITTIFCNISAHIDYKYIDDALRTIFTPNHITIGNSLFYLPSLYNFTFLIIYLISHYIMIALYDAIKTYSNKYLGFSIALFMSFIIDTMFMVPLYHFKDIYNANVNMIDVVKFLTANFMIVILTGVILSFIFPLLVKTRLTKKR